MKVEAKLLERNIIGVLKTNSIKHNFLLLAHEYLFVFKKMYNSSNDGVRDLAEAKVLVEREVER